MTAFVESCTKTVTGSAAAAERRSKGRPRARQLLRKLAGKRNILVTTHLHPDPDALASCLALCTLLTNTLPDAKVTVSVKGLVAGGVNAMFLQLTSLNPAAWDEAALAGYDAILLVDTQPLFANSPLPTTVTPIAVIDHHRGHGRRKSCPFCDIRPDVGATGSIIFSYFMELDQTITPDLAATLLFAIESDLAGAAGHPGELDNIALSNLTLLADARKLYKMRYAPLTQAYYVAMAAGLANAAVYDNAVVSFLGPVDAPEKPAVIADHLLRFDRAEWALVTGVFHGYLLLSLRTNGVKLSAAEMMRTLVRKIGTGGGHKTKAGGGIKLATGTDAELDRLRTRVRRRLLRALGTDPASRGHRLIPRAD